MSLTPTAHETIVDGLRLQSLLGIPSEVLDHAMATAYQLYRERRYWEAETICRGLLAADPTYWWSYSLYAATLQKLGRIREALAMVTLGLRHEPAHPKLLALREALETRIAAISAVVHAVSLPPQGGAVDAGDASEART